MAKGDLDKLRAQREAQYEARLARKPVGLPQPDRAKKARSAMRTTTHSVPKPVPATTHPSGYVGLAARLRVRFEAGDSDAEISQVLAGALGGRGGKTRSARLTAEQKSESARKAAKARWG